MIPEMEIMRPGARKNRALDDSRRFRDVFMKLAIRQNAKLSHLAAGSCPSLVGPSCSTLLE